MCRAWSIRSPLQRQLAGRARVPAASGGGGQRCRTSERLRRELQQMAARLPGLEGAIRRRAVVCLGLVSFVLAPWAEAALRRQLCQLSLTSRTAPVRLRCPHFEFTGVLADFAGCRASWQLMTHTLVYRMSFVVVTRDPQAQADVASASGKCARHHPQQPFLAATSFGKQRCKLGKR